MNFNCPKCKKEYEETEVYKTWTGNKLQTLMLALICCEDEQLLECGAPYEIWMRINKGYKL